MTDPDNYGSQRTGSDPWTGNPPPLTRTPAQLVFTRFAPLPLDYLDAARRVELDFYEFAVLAVLILQAKRDGDGGVVHSSAHALATEWPGLSESTAQKVLQRLEAKGYIRRFWTPGRRGKYPVAIHGYIQIPRGFQFRLDALATDNWMKPARIRCDRSDMSTGGMTHQETDQGTDQGTPIKNSEGEPGAGADAPDRAPASVHGDPSPSDADSAEPSVTPARAAALAEEFRARRLKAAAEAS